MVAAALPGHLQGYFLPASLFGLLGYAAVGVLGPDVTRYFLLCLPVVAVAILLGRALSNRIKGLGFFRLVCVGLIGIGGVLIAQALAS